MQLCELVHGLFKEAYHGIVHDGGTKHDLLVGCFAQGGLHGAKGHGQEHNEHKNQTEIPFHCNPPYEIDSA
ncbi:hypothetical protein SDC9_155688 [bioreactor metagenome]|uniref:Uncharacterized protein n=1 Tax=bioreactor metagenome TaxID=1076179 RepID=A0A645F442_9ZZZZ